MSKLDDLIDVTGDEAKAALKKELLALIGDAKADASDQIKDTARKIEQLLIDRKQDKINKDQLKMHLETHRNTLKQCINSHEINARARLERYTTGLIDFIKDKAIEAIL